VYALNRAGANSITPEIYREMSVLEVLCLFEIIEETLESEKKQLENAKNKKE
jgi:hypothetical protein